MVRCRILRGRVSGALVGARDGHGRLRPGQPLVGLQSDASRYYPNATLNPTHGIKRELGIGAAARPHLLLIRFCDLQSRRAESEIFDSAQVSSSATLPSLLRQIHGIQQVRLRSLLLDRHGRRGGLVLAQVVASKNHELVEGAVRDAEKFLAGLDGHSHGVTALLDDAAKEPMGCGRRAEKNSPKAAQEEDHGDAQNAHGDYGNRP